MGLGLGDMLARQLPGLDRVFADQEATKAQNALWTKYTYQPAAAKTEEDLFG